MTEAIPYIGIGVPLPAYRQAAADEAKFWLDELGMIGRDVEGLVDANVAVFAYDQNGERIGFMARTNTFPSVVTPGGKMVELGAMVKYGTANMNGVGRAMTQALVAIEQDIARSDEQIAMATNPHSEQAFRGGGAQDMPSEQLPEEVYGECSGCKLHEVASQNGRRCCATILNVAPMRAR